MAKPSSRTPLDSPADLAPAPDTGKPYGAPEDVPPVATGRKGKQPTAHLHVRIPVDLFQQLQDYCEDSGRSQTHVVAAALRSELEQRG